MEITGLVEEFADNTGLEENFANSTRLEEAEMVEEMELGGELHETEMVENKPDHEWVSTVTVMVEKKVHAKKIHAKKFHAKKVHAKKVHTRKVHAKKKHSTVGEGPDNVWGRDPRKTPLWRRNT